MSRLLRTVILTYLALTGLALHFGIIAIFIVKADFIYDVVASITGPVNGYSIPEKQGSITYNLQEEIAANFSEWIPLQEASMKSAASSIQAREFDSLTDAGKALKDGQTLVIGPGIYRNPLIIEANNTTVKGIGHVIIEKTSAEGKAAILIKGNNTSIENIECREVSVKDKNGSCVRLEGKDLRLFHVYFHNSQQGVLTGNNPGLVEVLDSRFERLGFNGSAHGIYVGGGRLLLHKSLFLAAKSQGHEIKSRAESTVIDQCYVASFSSDNSRLVDISNGGILIIKNSVIAQGRGSVNQDAISFGLEGKRYSENSSSLVNNIIILERPDSNVLFNRNKEMPALKGRNNIIISKNNEDINGINLFFRSRSEAGMKDYPQLPDLPSYK